MQHILVDYRERTGGLTDRLEASGSFQVSEEALRCGDIVVGRFLIERKTVPDLLASLSDGRLFRQLSTLRNNGARPLLVIEGAISRELEGVAPKFLRNVVLASTVKFAVPVIRTHSIDDTVSVLAWLGKHSGEIPYRPLLRTPGKKPSERESQQLFVLASLPQIGAGKAERLLKRFGNLCGVFTASIEELTSVEGIGEIQARSIAEISNSLYPKNV